MTIKSVTPRNVYLLFIAARSSAWLYYKTQTPSLSPCISCWNKSHFTSEVP